MYVLKGWMSWNMQSVVVDDSFKDVLFEIYSDGFQLICCDNHVRNQTNNVCVGKFNIYI